MPGNKTKKEDRRRIHIDDEILAALDVLGKDRKTTFQDLLDEAVRDLLKKYGRGTAAQKRQSSGQ